MPLEKLGGGLAPIPVLSQNAPPIEAVRQFEDRSNTIALVQRPFCIVQRGNGKGVMTLSA